MKKLPINKANLPRKGADTALSKTGDFNSTVARLRKASGKPEHVLVPMCCAVHDRPYVIIYSRTDPATRFRISEIVKKPRKETAGKKGLIARFLGGGGTSTNTYDSGDFDTSGRFCPWCHDPGTVVHCNDCGQTYCGGSTKQIAEDGTRFYRCVPRCGGSGFLSEYNKMHGKQGKTAGSGKGQKLLSPGKRAAGLNAPDRLKLEKK